ncbi:phosphodiester glycosidase family protein [Caldanaerobacter sp.]|uniref:phosphodiester glycosidase family protein n=1 Tax=Caldanaerobacter sp. TaxID=2930036 RepID=UPI003C74A36D
MKLSSKRLAAFFAFLLIFFVSLAEVTNAAYKILDQKQETEVISRGVTHTHLLYFTDEGFININVLKIDLENPYVDLSTIFSPFGIKERMSIRELANSYGAVAAINGDFFDPKTGFVIGATVKDGNLITDPASNGKMATFYIDKTGTPYIDYWAKNMSITLPDGTTIPIAAINKISSTFQYMVMYTRDWYGFSPGANENVPQLVEVVLDQSDTVLEVRLGQPPSEIPEGGYILAASGDIGNLLLKLNPGDKIQKNITTNPPFQDIKMAVSGGTILLKEGKIYPFTHEIKGYAARTSIGYTKDKKYIFMVTVDGPPYRGMTQEELANLMLSLGAHEALNLDGGGSTQMAIRPLGESKTVLYNYSPNSYERKVPNGIAVLNTAPPGNLYGIKLEVEDEKIFKGLHRLIKVKGYDENLNPVTLDPNEIQFSVTGIDGKFEGNYFLPLNAGKGFITARIGAISSTLEVNVLENPVILEFEPSTIEIDKSQKTKIKLFGKDAKGYRALIDPIDIEYQIYGNAGTINTLGTFTSANFDSSGAIMAKVLDKIAFLTVKVGEGSYFDYSTLKPQEEFSQYDPANREITVNDTDNSFRFMVFGDTKYNTLLKLQISLKAVEIANKEYKLAVFLGDINERALANLKTKYIAVGEKYQRYDYGNSTFIVLNNKNGTFVKPDPDQWVWFKDQLNKIQKDNLFILLPRPIWGEEGLNDKKEAKLFEETLKEFYRNTSKNIWIISNGNKKFYTILEDGIRYTETYGVNAIGTDIYNDFGFLSVMVNGKEIYYKFKPVINPPSN